MFEAAGYLVPDYAELRRLALLEFHLHGVATDGTSASMVAIQLSSKAGQKDYFTSSAVLADGPIPVLQTCIQ